MSKKDKNPFLTDSDSDPVAVTDDPQAVIPDDPLIEEARKAATRPPTYLEHWPHIRLVAPRAINDPKRPGRHILNEEYLAPHGFEITDDSVLEGVYVFAKGAPRGLYTFVGNDPELARKGQKTGHTQTVPLYTSPDFGILILNEEGAKLAGRDINVRCITEGYVDWRLIAYTIMTSSHYRRGGIIPGTQDNPTLRGIVSWSEYQQWADYNRQKKEALIARKSLLDAFRRAKTGKQGIRN